MIWLLLLIGGIYFFVIASFFYGWEKLHPFKILEIKSTRVSVIVPMRNEEKNIAFLLNDLSKQNYPLEFYEIIVIDDHSTDQSIKKATECNINNSSILKLPKDITGKKAALSFGIKNAKGELIITTDADCRLGGNWIQSIVAFYQQANPVMIMGPVIAATTYPSKSQSSGFSFLRKMLGLELFSLLGSTAGSASIGHPVMCNGANLAFPIAVYPEIEYIYDNKLVKSGDDIFAMLELNKKYPGRVQFLKSKEAAIYTEISTSALSFFGQRSRWASKSKFYREPFIIITALVIFGINLSLFGSLIYGILCHNFIPFFALLSIKSVIDFPFLYRVTAFFGEKRLMLWFPIVQMLYFLYVCITVFIAFVLPIGWKGRRI